MNIIHFQIAYLYKRAHQIVIMVKETNVEIEPINSTVDKLAMKWWVVVLILSIVQIGIVSGIMFTSAMYALFWVCQYVYRTFYPKQ